MIFLDLFITFLKIGAFTFGGGYAMLPLIMEEVANHGWISESELINFIAVSESTPGPFAINVSTYIGMETAGLLGAFCATLGVVAPSFIIILIIATFFKKYQNSSTVKGCMNGLRPAVIGLIGAAFVSTAITVFFPLGFEAEVIKIPEIAINAAIFIGALVLALKKVHPIIIIVLSAAVGIAVGYTGL